MSKPDNYESLPAKQPVSASTPLFLDFKPEDPDGYGSGWPTKLKAPGPSGKSHFKAYQGMSIKANLVVVNLILPPLAFACTSTLLCFRWHFVYPRMVWVLSLCTLIPAAISMNLARKARSQGKPAGWSKLSAFLFVLAFFMAAVFGDVTFWFFSHPFFFIESLKSYSNINPAQVSGLQLMDAGKVHFSDDARLALDLGMSFTNWDVYCVAPITTDEGLPTHGSTLATYDIWAVGVNCCTSSQSNFHCGEYNNNNARAGLRQVGEEQRKFFHLAVQQAEAAYNIRADHPIFFHWVQDPQAEEGYFFQSAFETWILSNCVHMVVNGLCVLVYVMATHKPQHTLHFPK